MVRHKNRYFAVELKVQDKPLHIPLQLKRSGIFSAVLGKVQEIHGDFGLAAVRQGFTTKYCNPYTKIVLIRVQHGAHRLVASVLPLIKSINNIPVQMTVLHVGATMMKCFKVIKKYQQRKLEQFWNETKNDEKVAELKESILSVAMTET